MITSKNGKESKGIWAVLSLGLQRNGISCSSPSRLANLTCSSALSSRTHGSSSNTGIWQKWTSFWPQQASSISVRKATKFVSIREMAPAGCRQLPIDEETSDQQPLEQTPAEKIFHVQV
jgi:hypothetical protein